MIEVTKKTIKDFEKLLIELGGFHELHEDGSIWRISDNEQVAVPLGKRNLPLILFEEGMSSTVDCIYLNPFSEGLGTSRDREWFYDMLQKVLGGIIKSIVKQTAFKIVKKEHNQNYDTYDMINKVGPFCDEQFMTDIDKIQLIDWLTIYYNKSRKTAEAQTAIFTDEFKASHNKFRKKTWDGLEAFYMELFRTTHLEESYHYQSNLISIPETDAKLQVICAIIKDIDPFSKDILGIDLHSGEIMEHLPNVEGYGKLYSWAVLRRSPMVDEKKDTGKAAPSGVCLPSLSPLPSAAPAAPMVTPYAVPAAAATPTGGILPNSIPVASTVQPAMMPIQQMMPAQQMIPAQQMMPAPQMMQGYGMTPVAVPQMHGTYNPQTGYTPGGMMFQAPPYYR